MKEYILKNVFLDLRGVFMERVLSQDERIRRAEELYARRRIEQDIRGCATVNVENVNNNKIAKKLIIQSILCLIIYGMFYTIKSSPNILPEEVMYKISDILEYDINVQELYRTITTYINKNENHTQNIEKTEETVQEEQLQEETLSITEEKSEADTEKIVEEIEPIDTEIEIQKQPEESSSLTQMQVDAEYIKANYSLIHPLTGEITSRFGIRNPSIATVPKYHTGIDIARVTGTVIVAAMEGTVELVSSEGDYGKHVKISNGEVSTLYAHCNAIYVKEGDYITQGQEIAEVGATGNVTGPHLHFEVRRNNQYIDPDLILQF